MSAWMERSYLDDLRDEWKDARDDEIRHPTAHHLDCRCSRCVYDRLNDEADEPHLPRLGYWEGK